MSKLATIRDLEIKRGRFTLRIPEWELGAGRIVGLVGPNGAGKTTLLEALAGMRRVDSGVVEVLGSSPWKNPVEVRRKLGFMSDDMPLFSMRIRKLLRTISAYYPTWNPELAQDLIERFEVDVDKHVGRLSKGEGTRVRLITALAFEPRVLLLDEPATGLDLSGRFTLLQTVLDVSSGSERAVVISSHSLDDMERICDELVVLSNGHLVKQGPTDELIGDERTLDEALMAWGAAG